MNAMDEARALVAADDRQDFDFASRGFITTSADGKTIQADVTGVTAS